MCDFFFPRGEVRFIGKYQIRYLGPKHQNFLNVVEEVGGDQVCGCPMFQLYCKLKKLKIALRQLNKEAFSNISGRVENARTNINTMQMLLQENSLNSMLLRDVTEAVKKYSSLLRAEKKFYKQKGRIQWLNL